jgi:hypothetical protein
MDHQVYEDWLFIDLDKTEKTLTPEQEASLQEHLETCESCRLLAAAWQEMESQLSIASMLAPESGFAQRWQTRLEADLERLHRKQSVTVLAFSVGGAILLFASLGLLALPALLNPDLVIWTWLYRVFNLVSYVFDFQEIFSALFRTATGIIPSGLWVILIGLLSELGVLWVVSYRLLTNPRRISQ